MRTVLAVVLVLWVAACRGDSTETPHATCVPGSTSECLCLDGTDGVQLCDDDGVYGSCQCFGAATDAAGPGLPSVFVRIEPGTFTMGSPEGEEGRHDNETQHEVTITRAFWLQSTEVTQGQWRAVMGTSPSYFSSCGDDCPVETVSWEDAVAYVNALSASEGLDACYSGSTFAGLGCEGYRLPTESEWEYAARAGTTTATYAGDLTAADCDDATLPGIAWFSCNSARRTHEVGTKRVNGWGLYDMLGNVSEWTGDWYSSSYPSGSVRDPLGPDGGSSRVVRGGGWGGGARFVRAARRSSRGPARRSSYLGFRPARSAP